MRVVIQRVKKAKVEIAGKLESEIGSGLMVLVGVSKTDTAEDAAYIAGKICGLRIFTDENDKMNLSVEDVGGDILLVSQFTLYADARKGRRPSFDESSKGDHAKEMYEGLADMIRSKGFDVKTGIFGADMDISLINHGPVTIQLDSKKLY